MSVEDFASRWAQKERKCGLEESASAIVVNGSWALPQSAAPFLSFSELKAMPRIQEVYGLQSWSKSELAPLQPYRMVGADGAGNPICIEESTGEVWLLDHEDGFATKQFINTSIRNLAECLLHYMGAEQPDSLAAAIRAEDSRAIHNNTFWWHEIEALRQSMAQQDIQPDGPASGGSAG